MSISTQLNQVFRYNVNDMMINETKYGIAQKYMTSQKVTTEGDVDFTVT